MNSEPSSYHQGWGLIALFRGEREKLVSHVGRKVVRAHALTGSGPSSRLSRTPAPGDLTPSSDLRKASNTHVDAQTHALKTLTHIRENLLKKFKKNVHFV